MSLNDLAHLIEQLDGLPLLPCGAGPEGKAPIDPTTGRGLEGWESKAFTPDQILGFNGKVIAVGTRTGPAAGQLLILDIDGRSLIYFSLPKLQARFGAIAHLPYSMKILLENVARRECSIDVQAGVSAAARGTPGGDHRGRPATVG